MGKQPCINPLIVIIINCCILKYAPKKAMLVSEYATKNRFTIVTVKAFRAFIIKEGSPKIIIFCTMLHSKRNPTVLSAILCFAFKNIINAKTIETEYPKTVAVEAPLIPIAGKKPIPKIRSGSKMKLVITPVS